MASDGSVGLREALEFYADEDSWTTTFHDEGERGYDPPKAPEDKGAIARAALAACEGSALTSVQPKARKERIEPPEGSDVVGACDRCDQVRVISPKDFEALHSGQLVHVLICGGTVRPVEVFRTGDET